MNKRYLLGVLATLCVCSTVWAASDLAPALPDLNLPAESEQPAPAAAPAKPAVAATTQKKTTSVKKNTVKKTTAAKTAAKKTAAASKKNVPPVTNTVTKVNTEEIAVENLIPQQQIQPVAAAVPPAEVASVAAAPAAPATSAPTQGAPTANAAAPALPQAQTLASQTAAGIVSKVPAPQKLVQYNPPTDRDPTLSPDDTLLLKHREEERLRALEAERQRKLAEERRRLAELERQRQLELERLRDPSREVRGKIRVSGIIGQEVFIGNRIYTVGKSVYGARIVKVLPESVVFTYKGQQFTKKVDLQ